MTKQNILATLLFASFLIQGCVVADSFAADVVGGGNTNASGTNPSSGIQNEDLDDDEDDEENAGNNNAFNGVLPQPAQPLVNPNIIELEVTGIGVAPEESCSPAQAVALAKRAAIVDAYRQLGEQMYGVQVTATDNVRDMVLRNSSVKTKINAIIRGAQVKDSNCRQGVCQVSMELKLDRNVWSQVFGI